MNKLYKQLVRRWRLRTYRQYTVVRPLYDTLTGQLIAGTGTVIYLKKHTNVFPQAGPVVFTVKIGNAAPFGMLVQDLIGHIRCDK